MIQNLEDIQIKLTRKYLKMKIIEDNLSFRNHSQQKQHVQDLLSRTTESGESNSALVIGPRGAGKTTVRILNYIYISILNYCEQFIFIICSLLTEYYTT